MADGARGICYRRLELTGRVQGIGFRPYVAEAAVLYRIRGSVRNTGGAVEVIAIGEAGDVASFLEEITHPALPFARITQVRELVAAVYAEQEKQGFLIEESDTKPSGGADLPPDLPLCEACTRELADTESRRCGYALNSCASCGPRLSILRTLPYDRDTTSMEPFAMCRDCAQEYAREGDRRRHAQTIGCPHCGPVLLWEGADTACAQDALRAAVLALLDGLIVAVKGIGGYHLVCRPDNGAAVRALRSLKGREAKPLAVMFPTMKYIHACCEVSPAEEALLCSPVRPIVPLWKTREAFASEVTGENARLGCFLPYTAMQVLLLRETGPLVMTSANRSGEPLIYEDERALAFFRETANPCFAGVLYHERAILRPLDDSVMAIAAGEERTLRRGRGFAPEPIPLGVEAPTSILTVGGDLKGSICFASAGYAYLCGHIGDLEDAGALARLEEDCKDYGALLGIKPERIACDKHPRYHSMAFAAEQGLPLVPVQHHHAHIASVMAEHRLTRVLGVALDGTGFGDDGTVWGGEFLLCEGATYQRMGHLCPFLQQGGDESAKDARKSAIGLLHSENLEELLPRDEDIPLILAALEHHVNTARCSSMGRVFDAAAFLLGICPRNDYEGQCAIQLEQAAERALRAGKAPVPMAFTGEWADGVLLFSAKEVLRALCAAQDAEAAACGFHQAVAAMIVQGCEEIAAREAVKEIALSGGVFQNKLVLEGAISALTERGFHVYTNRSAPCNDGGIALGQAYLALLREGE